MSSKTIQVDRPDGTHAIVRGVEEIDQEGQGLFLYGPGKRLLYGFGEWTTWRVYQPRWPGDDGQDAPPAEEGGS